jgi:hypothetical protein
LPNADPGFKDTPGTVERAGPASYCYQCSACVAVVCPACFAHVKLRPVDFATDGIYVCGTAQGPRASPGASPRPAPRPDYGPLPSLKTASSRPNSSTSPSFS